MAEMREDGRTEAGGDAGIEKWGEEKTEGVWWS